MKKGKRVLEIVINTNLKKRILGSIFSNILSIRLRLHKTKEYLWCLFYLAQPVFWKRAFEQVKKSYSKVERYKV